MAKRTPEYLKAYHAAYYLRNREKALEYQRQYRGARREQLRLEAIEYRKRNPGKRREWRITNLERDRARDQAYKAANAERIAEYRARPDVQDRMREHYRAYNARHADKIKAYRERPDVKARFREYQRQWLKDHPDFVRTKAARRRAKIAGVAVETVRPSEVLRLGQGICGICGEPVDPANFHVDHIMPLALGGEHSYANTQPAHPSCNVRKGARAA